MKRIIGITIGDPAGIGPEIVLKAAARLALSKEVRLVVFGDKALLTHLQKKVFRRRTSPRFDVIDFRNVPLRGFKFGVPIASGGKASGDYIAAAVRAALKGMIDAVVTAPINKVAFRMGGWGKRFVGHTEMLASMTRTSNYALMLLQGSLRAIHVTSHVPLRRVPSLLTVNRIYQTIFLAHRGLREMGIGRPSIVVCGLNPHAGEGGLLGDEEKRIIQPAIQKARRAGFRVTGPFSSDTVWPMVLSKKHDVGVAMYHDQGQIPIKLMGFDSSDKRQTVVRGVNATIGLPIIRTSVAHGTAYGIAGKGLASEESLMDAIALAAKMAKIKNQ